ncbi:hypothetical protein HN709_04800 [Candidatus Peregrinibacteria bacterium]|jgi:thymidylate kinase|nr:hypothetical protein [Candidatus Peregrinibacteria bacterium]MBT7736981.1 hypothetical protein [Candidatus Peregrinibacteria bacterium]
MKGTLITIYGINNIGKTTQCMRLVERLKAAGHDAHYVKYPVYDVQPSGDFINGVLRSPGEQHISEEELQMWFVVNRYQFQPTLEKWLNEGAVVVAEDYTGTGIAWGIAKGLEEKWVENINSKVRREDLAIVIEGERFLKAVEDVHVHERNDELVEKSLKSHDHLATKYGWTRVPLQDGIEATSDLIFEKVENFLKDS